MERKHPERLPYTIVQEPRLGTSLGSASGYLASRLGSPGSGGLAALTSMAGLGGNISTSQSGGSTSQGQDQNSAASSTGGQGSSLMTMSNSSSSGKALAALTSRLPAVAAALLPMSQ